ncbi:MAG: hypothetical protein WCO35_01180 [Candidatus Nomurabacteria bacterium]
MSKCIYLTPEGVCPICGGKTKNSIRRFNIWRTDFYYGEEGFSINEKVNPSVDVETSICNKCWNNGNKFGLVGINENAILDDLRKVYHFKNGAEFRPICYFFKYGIKIVVPYREKKENISMRV